jgi:hypothetical protein
MLFYFWLPSAAVVLIACLMLWLMLRELKSQTADGSPAASPSRNGRPLVFLTGPTTLGEDERRRAVERISNLNKAVWSHTKSRTIAPPVQNRRDLNAILHAEAIAVLPLWNYYPLPRLHVAIANALGIPVVRAHDLHPIPPEHRQLGTTEVDGVCDCQADAVIQRVGELFGDEHKRQLVERN